MVIRFFFIPATTANDLRLRRIFYPRFYPLHYFLILILEKDPVFPFSMLSAKQGNYWYHFITSLVWRGPWLGIELGTSRTRCQHSTTRLSRRRYLGLMICDLWLVTFELRLVHLVLYSFKFKTRGGLVYRAYIQSYLPRSYATTWEAQYIKYNKYYDDWWWNWDGRV